MSLESRFNLSLLISSLLFPCGNYAKTVLRSRTLTISTKTVRIKRSKRISIWFRSFLDFDDSRPNLQFTESKYRRFLCKTGKEPESAIVEKLRVLALYHVNNIRLTGTE